MNVLVQPGVVGEVEMEVEVEERPPLHTLTPGGPKDTDEIRYLAHV